MVDPLVKVHGGPGAGVECLLGRGDRSVDVLAGTPGTEAMTSSLHGETTSIRSVVAARTHSPSTKIVS